ncbi:hypothetical protein DM860_017796 [Cuscuta australis]|uniref:Uncharacterized protein n=1 Tax=Cuscuta australis TaxID=267555 RepID=A0A328DUE1_9ASTE|nr:hypothetical protein DM860_017796 [Cuscuta australis]
MAAKPWTITTPSTSVATDCRALGFSSAKPSLITSREWPKDESGRWVLRCVGKGWVPSQAGVDALNDAIMSSYRDAWPTWSLVSEDVKARWWDFFKDRCTWNPARTDTMKKNWKHRGSKQLSSLLRHARAANKKPDWCGEAAWNDLQTYWSSDKYKLISEQNSKNRGSAEGGALHTTGRVSHLDVIEQMSKEKQRPVEVDEAFLVTRQRKDGGWVDSRSMETYEIAESEDGSTNGTSDINSSKKLAIWQETVGGKSKGKVYGTADLSSNFTREGATMFYTTQECCDDELSTHDVRLQKELEELRHAQEAERLAHEEERRAQEEKIAEMEKSMELKRPHLHSDESAHGFQGSKRRSSL